MLETEKKFIKLISALIVVVLILLGYAFFQDKDRDLQIVFFDVGQGDAILIKTPNDQKILIDGGPDNKLVNKIGKYFSFADKTIDLMILTHAHSDHLVGLVEILKRYQVNKVLYNGPAHTTPEFFQFLELIKENNIPLEVPLAGQEYIFSGDIKLKILYPFVNLTNEKLEDLNEGSLVSQLIYKENKFLFMSDLPQELEKIVLESNNDLTSAVIKIGHHGSRYSTSDQLLKEVRPQLAIISVGEDNKFGHPDPLTIDKLDKNGIKISRTDQNGEIIIKSDGQGIILP